MIVINNIIFEIISKHLSEILILSINKFVTSDQIPIKKQGLYYVIHNDQIIYDLLHHSILIFT